MLIFVCSCSHRTELLLGVYLHDGWIWIGDRPVTARFRKCRFNRHHSIIIKESLESLTVTLRCCVSRVETEEGVVEVSFKTTKDSRVTKPFLHSQPAAYLLVSDVSVCETNIGT